MKDSNEQGGVRLDCCTIQPFRLTGDSHSLAEKWKRWQRSFNLYVCSKGCKDDLQKKSLLLHSAGLEVQDLYYSVVDEKTDKHSFEEAMQLLNDNLMPQRNIPFERQFVLTDRTSATGNRN